MTTIHFYRYLHTISSSSSPPSSKSSIVSYLTQTLGFPKSRAVLFVNKFSSTQTNPQSVIHCLNSHGFRVTDIQKWVTESPHILFSDVEKTLKPRIKFFQDLGLTGSDLEQCGIVGAQLASVVRRQPRLLIMGEQELKDLVSKVLDMGFTTDSRMLVHAIHCFSCLSDETFERKFQLFLSYGFTKDEYMDMFNKMPVFLRVSEAKLKTGLDFFLNTVKFDKQVLVRRPMFLMYSLQERVIPRFNVLNIMMSKKILKKMPSFRTVIRMREDAFLEKFIYKDRVYADELLLVYKSGDLLLQTE